MTAKTFTENVGMCWHGQSNNYSSPVICSCGESMTWWVAERHFKLCNPAWDNPVDIKHAIQNISCDKCGGSGWYKCTVRDCQEDCPNGYYGTWESACTPDKDAQCTCNNGKVDLWDEFVEWHGAQVFCFISILNSSFVFQGGFNAAVEILTTPELLMMAFNSFMEGRE